MGKSDDSMIPDTNIAIWSMPETDIAVGELIVILEKRKTPRFDKWGSGCRIY